MRKLLNTVTNLTLKASNTTIAKFANTEDPDETAHNESSQLDLQSLIFQQNTVSIKSFLKFGRRNFVVFFFGAL